jgi:addiction module RelE/StbE family toxin
MKPIWTTRANNDLISIIEYVAQDNPRAARDLARRIQEKASLLSQHPMLGKSSNYSPQAREILVHKHYVLIYRLHGEKQTPHILRVIHTARNRF